MKVLLKILLSMLFITNVHAIEATHGMVLFGQQKIMAYHLPMFHKIHARQVILELSMNETMKSIIAGLQENGGLVTFVPDPFDLETFLQHPHALKGDLYKGHFEKNGEVLLNGITLEVEKILYNKPIKKNNQLSEEHYRFFGSATDFYMIHLLDGGSHQDQILKLSVNIWMNGAVQLGERAIAEEQIVLKNKIVSNESLGKIEIQDVELPCRHGWCMPTYSVLEIINAEEIFSDSVM